MNVMKYSTKPIAFLFLLLYVFLPASAQEAKIEFYEGNWNQVLVKAAEENKLIFVDAYTEHCLPCKMLDKYVFTNEEVIEFFNENFINFKVDVERQENAGFTSKYNIRLLPTLLFFNPDGELMINKTGGLGTSDFLEIGRGVVQLVKEPQFVAANRSIKFTRVRLDDFNGMYERGTRYPKFLNEYAYLLKKFHLPYNTVVNQFLKMQKSKMRKSMNRQFIYDFALSLENNAMDYLLKDLAWYKETFGGQRVNEKVKDAVHNSVLTAIRLRDGKLFKKAIDVIDKAKLPDSDAFTFEMKSYYYQETGKWDDYAKMCIKYLKDNNVTDPVLLNDIAKNFYNSVDNQKMLKYALKWVKKSMKIENEHYNNHTHAALLYRLGNRGKAIKAGNEAVEIARIKGNSYVETLRLLDIIQSK